MSTPNEYIQILAPCQLPEGLTETVAQGPRIDEQLIFLETAAT